MTKETMCITVNANSHEEICEYEKKLREDYPDLIIIRESIRENRRLGVFGKYYTFFHIHQQPGGSTR